MRLDKLNKELKILYDYLKERQVDINNGNVNEYPTLPDDPTDADYDLFTAQVDKIEKEELLPIQNDIESKQEEISQYENILEEKYKSIIGKISEIIESLGGYEIRNVRGYEADSKYMDIYNKTDNEFVMSIRLSDHAQPTGGGYNEEKQERHGESDISLFVDIDNFKMDDVIVEFKNKIEEKLNEDDN